MFKKHPQPVFAVPATCVGGTRDISREYRGCLEGPHIVFPGVLSAYFLIIRSKVPKWVSRERHIRYQVCLEPIFGDACLPINGYFEYLGRGSVLAEQQGTGFSSRY